MQASGIGVPHDKGAVSGRQTARACNFTGLTRARGFLTRTPISIGSPRFSGSMVMKRTPNVGVVARCVRAERGRIEQALHHHGVLA